MKLDNFLEPRETAYSCSDELEVLNEISCFVSLHHPDNCDYFEVSVSICDHEGTEVVGVDLETVLSDTWRPVAKLDVNWKDVFTNMGLVPHFNWDTLGCNIAEQMIARVGKCQLDIYEMHSEDRLSVELCIPKHPPLSGTVPLDQCSGILHKI